MSTVQTQLDFEQRLPVSAQLGMAQADEHADERWKREVDAAIRATALTHETFTADDVRAELERNQFHFVTHNQSAMGSRMSEVAATMRYMERTEQVQRSTRGKAKGHYLRVWRSRIFEGNSTKGGLRPIKPVSN